MLPIILASIAVVAISIERYWTLNEKKIAPRHLLGQVWSWIKNNQIDANRLSELKRSSDLGKILAAGLSNSRHGREFMKDSIQETANQVIHEMERYIGALGTIAAIAPLMGLLGTPSVASSLLDCWSQNPHLGDVVFNAIEHLGPDVVPALRRWIDQHPEKPGLFVLERRLELLERLPTTAD